MSKDKAKQFIESLDREIAKWGEEKINAVTDASRDFFGAKKMQTERIKEMFLSLSSQEEPIEHAKSSPISMDEGSGIIPMPKGFEFHNACNEPCDTLVGPCICGATHRPEEWYISKYPLSSEVNSKDKNKDSVRFFVFELKDECFIQISVGFKTLQEAESFITTMKEGYLYRDSKLVVSEVLLNFKNF